MRHEYGLVCAQAFWPSSSASQRKPSVVSRVNQIRASRRAYCTRDETSLEQTRQGGGTSQAAELTHLDRTGAAHMVTVSGKPISLRRAVAAGRVVFGRADTLGLIEQARIAKGDVMAVARLAGIMAAKNCAALIPLCHPISISGVVVQLDLVPPASSPPLPHGGIVVHATVECLGQTGVEMEAYTSVAASLLTVIDMIKAVDREARIDDISLVEKLGGRTGHWTRPQKVDGSSS